MKKITAVTLCILFTFFLSSCIFDNGNKVLKINSIDLTKENIYRFCEISLDAQFTDYELRWQGGGSTKASYKVDVKAATQKYYFYNAVITVEVTLTYKLETGNMFFSQKTNKTKKETKEIVLSMGGNGKISGIFNLGGVCKDGGTSKVEVTDVAGFIMES